MHQHVDSKGYSIKLDPSEQPVNLPGIELPHRSFEKKKKRKRRNALFGTEGRFYSLLFAQMCAGRIQSCSEGCLAGVLGMFGSLLKGTSAVH